MSTNLINGTPIHEFAMEQVARELNLSIVTVRDQVEHGAAIMVVAVKFAEQYWNCQAAL